MMTTQQSKAIICSKYDNYEKKFTNSDVVEVTNERGKVLYTVQLKSKDSTKIKTENVEIKDTDEILDSILKDFLERSKFNDINEYFECIQKAVMSLHSDKFLSLEVLSLERPKGKEKPKFPSPYIEEKDNKERYQDFSPYFIERAMLTHNCLCHCSIDSVFKISLVRIGNIEFAHAYNLVTDGEGNRYIFDSTFPNITVENGFDFNVRTIDEDTYLSMIDNECSTEVKHYGVLTLPEYSIIYNSNKEILVPDLRERPKENKSYVLTTEQRIA